MGCDGDPILTPALLQAKLQTLTHSSAFCVAYSGGVDSHVLLHGLATLAPLASYSLSAIHVHHGLSTNADLWALHCEKTCQSLQIPLKIIRVEAVTQGESPEAVARAARWEAFREEVPPDQSLVLAHHAQDQAETILFRLLRGTGPLGLGGMAEKRAFRGLEVLRPLLNFSKEAIEAYAKHHALTAIQDESNDNNRFDRNYLRNVVIPHIRSRWPTWERAVNRAGFLCHEEALFNQVQVEKEREIAASSGSTLSVSRLLSLPERNRRAVIRHWIQEQGFLPPSFDHLKRIDREILKAKPGSKPHLRINHYWIRRQKDSLALEAVGPKPL